MRSYSVVLMFALSKSISRPLGKSRSIAVFILGDSTHPYSWYGVRIVIRLANMGFCRRHVDDGVRNSV